MPSIIIGGENTNVGLRYLDELARQRELALREAAFARSASSGDSSASGANNFGAGYTSSTKGYRPPQNAQEAPIAPNGGGATGGGLSDDYNQRILQMRKLYANQQNEDNQRRVQELQSEVGSHDNSLKTMTAMLSQAQEQDQVDGLVASMRGLMTKKAAAINEMRERQYRHPQTGDASTDQALSFTPHAQPAQVEPDTSQYQAMGTFAAQGVQAKNAEKEKLKAADDENKKITIASKRVNDVRQKVNDAIGLLRGASPDSIKEMGDGADYAKELEDATKAYDDMIGNKAHVDQTKNVLNMFKQASREAEDVWKRKGEEDKFRQEHQKEQLETTKQTKLTQRELAVQASKERIQSTLRTSTPDATESAVNAYAQTYQKVTGEALPEEEKHALMMSNPGYAATEHMLDRFRGLSPNDALAQAVAYRNEMNQPAMSSASVSSETGDRREQYKPSGWELAAAAGGYRAEYPKKILDAFIASMYQKLQMTAGAPDSQGFGVSEGVNMPLDGNTGKPVGWNPEERTRQRAQDRMKNKSDKAYLGKVLSTPQNDPYPAMSPEENTWAGMSGI